VIIIKQDILHAIEKGITEWMAKHNFYFNLEAKEKGSTRRRQYNLAVEGQDSALGGNKALAAPAPMGRVTVIGAARFVFFKALYFDRDFWMECRAWFIASSMTYGTPS
jgi:hypothetical protein